MLLRCLASGGQFGLFLNSQRPTGFHAQGGSQASGGQVGLFLNSQRPTALYAPGGSQASGTNVLFYHF